MPRFVVFAIALLAGFPAGVLANSSLYDALKTETSSGSTPAASVCIGPVGDPYPCDPVTDEKITTIKEALLKRAMHYRNLFFSTNACGQSPENNRYLKFGSDFSEMQEELTEIEVSIRNEVNADTSIRDSRKIDTIKLRVAQATRDYVTTKPVEDDGDERFLGNCVHLSRTSFLDLKAEFSEVPKLRIGIWEFADYKSPLNLPFFNGVRHPNYHTFVMINCGEDYYIFDGWRGKGEVHGPFVYEPSSQKLTPTMPGESIDPYFDKAISPWLIHANK